MDTQSAGDPKKRARRSAIGFAAIVLGAALSWAVVAEYLLKISSRYWFWIPIGLLLVVLYWRLAWGAIGTYLESPVDEKRGWATGAGCMILALAVFVLICLLVSIPLLG